MMTFLSFCGSVAPKEAVFLQLSEKITFMILWFEYFETFRRGRNVHMKGKMILFEH